MKDIREFEFKNLDAILLEGHDDLCFVVETEHGLNLVGNYNYGRLQRNFDDIKRVYRGETDCYLSWSNLRMAFCDREGLTKSWSVVWTKEKVLRVTRDDIAEKFGVDRVIIEDDE